MKEEFEGTRWPAILAMVLSFLVIFPVSVGARMVPLSRSFARQGYKQVKRQDGVTVYKHRFSSLIKLGADGRFRGTPEQVSAALLDYNHHARAVGRVSKSKILERGEGWIIVYQRLSLPIISDRDFTLKVTWGSKDGVHWIRFRCLKGRGPDSPDGVIRLSHHQGSWQLRATSDGKRTLARFQVSTDMAGDLPRWMARSGADGSIPDLFQAIQKLIPGKN